MKKLFIIIIGLLVIALGIGMFFFGASMFTYRGGALNPIISKAGELSFIFWLPTIVVGLVIILGSVISTIFQKK